MATIGTLAVNVVAKTAGFTKGITNAQASMARFGKYAAAAGAAAAGLGAAMLRTSENINRALTKSMAIMDDTSESMRQNLLKTAVDVAKTTEKSTQEVAGAYMFLASAGLDAEKTLKAMPVVARFAQAGNFDLAIATDLAMDSQAALGLQSKDTATSIENLTRVTDVLVKGNNIANASVEQLATSLTNGAASALKIVNKDMEEGVAVLSAFAEVGIKGEEAGTAFGIVMRDMQTQAIKNKSAFRAAGVEVYDSTGRMKNMADIVEDLEGLLAGLSDEQKKVTLAGLGFTDKSVKYTQSLLGMSEKIRDYEKALRNAGGAAADVAAKSMTDLQRATAQLRGSWDQLSLSVGNAAEKLGLFKAASEGAEGAAVLINNALGSGKKDKTKLDLLQTASGSLNEPVFGMDVNPLSRQRKGWEWLFGATGMMPNSIAPANPNWGRDNQAALAAAGGTQGGVDAKQNAQVFGKWLANGMASAQGAARRGALVGDNALSGVEGMAAKGRQMMAQRALGQLTFGALGTLGGSDQAWREKQAEAARKAEEAARRNSQPRGTLSFARTGSVESYRQRMSIGKQSEADKIRRQQLKEQTKTRVAVEKLANAPKLAPANF